MPPFNISEMLNKYKIFLHLHHILTTYPSSIPPKSRQQLLTVINLPQLLNIYHKLHLHQYFCKIIRQVVC